jgi:hypothetical protein
VLECRNVTFEPFAWRAGTGDKPERVWRLRLALGVLRRFTGFVQADFLALDFS